MLRDVNISVDKWQNISIPINQGVSSKIVLGTLDLPSRNRVKSCCLPLNLIQTGLFEGFLTIVRQLKDIAVKGGFCNDHKWNLKNLYKVREY